MSSEITGIYASKSDVGKQRSSPVSPASISTGNSLWQCGLRVQIVALKHSDLVTATFKNHTRPDRTRAGRTVLFGPYTGCV